MKARFVFAVVAIGLLGVPASSTAQTVSAEVTLNMPVNLTQLGPDVAKVRVGCSINSDPITTGGTKHEVVKTQEIPVSGGQVVTTASLVFSFTGLDNPVGKSATIYCTLMGWSASQQAWVQFTGGATNPSFRMQTIPPIDASFVW